MNVRHLKFALIFLTCHASFSQVIEGIVVDQSSQRPLENVAVTNGKQVVLTGPLGEFSFYSDSLPLSVTFHLTGYLPKSMILDASGFQKIILEANDVELESVLIASSRIIGSVAQSTSNISILSQAALKRNDNISLPQVLNQSPGVVVHQGTLSTNRITIRGIGTRNPFGTSKIRAYYQEIPLTNGSGETTIEDLDLATIGRVEIQKGPNSSLFGAGLGGYINILPNYPAANERSAQTSFQYGSFNTFRWLNRFELGQENGSLSLIHSKIKSEGYRDNNSYNRESLTALGSWHFSERTRVSMIGNFTYLKSFIPSSIGYTLYKNSPKSAASTWDTAKGFEEYDDQKIGLGTTHYFSKQVYLSGSTFYNYRKNYEPRPRPSLNILSEQTHGLGYRISGTYEGQKNQISFGVEGFHDMLSWKTIENLYDTIGSGAIEGDLLSRQRADRGYFNVFSEWKHSLNDHLSITSGVNFNKSFYDVRDQFLSDGDSSASRSFTPVISPRLGLVYSHDQLRLFANISHGFSTPSLDETFPSDEVRNIHLKAEQGWNFEIGSRASYPKFGYESTIYLILIEDLLVSRRNANDVFVGVNAGSTRNFGYEQSINFTILNGHTRQMTAYANTTLQLFEFIDFVDGTNDYSGNELTGTPKMVANLGVDYRSTNGPYANVNYRFTGKMPITDDNTVYNQGYNLLNSRVGFFRETRYWTFDVYAGLQNILNEKYASMISVNAAPIGGNEPRYYYPGLPRNYYTGLSVKYTL